MAEVEFSNIFQELLSKFDPDRPYEQAILKVLLEIAKKLGALHPTLKETPSIPEINMLHYLQGIYAMLEKIASKVGVPPEQRVVVQLPYVPQPHPVSPSGGGTTETVSEGKTYVLPLPLPASWFHEVDVPDDGITVNPGERAVLLDYEVPAGSIALLYELGISDADYTQYSLFVDGNPVIQDHDTPLGLYNSPYRFPQPLLARSRITVSVLRDSDAPAPQTYVAKMRLALIPEEYGNIFLSLWG